MTAANIAGTATGEGSSAGAGVGVQKPKRPRAGRMTKEKRSAMVRACALRVVAEQGIGNANHTAVAGEAGVSVATVFFYFPSQVGLLEAVLDDVAAFLLNDIIRSSIDSAASPRLAIERMLLAFAASIDSNPDVARVWLDWSTAIRHEIWARYLVFHQEACRLIRDLVMRGQNEGTLRRSVEPDDAAYVVVGLGHMIAQMKFAGSSAAQIDRTVHTLVLNYIGAPA